MNKLLLIIITFLIFLGCNKDKSKIIDPENTYYVQFYMGSVELKHSTFINFQDSIISSVSTSIYPIVRNNTRAAVLAQLTRHISDSLIVAGFPGNVVYESETQAAIDIESVYWTQYIDDISNQISYNFSKSKTDSLYGDYNVCVNQWALDFGINNNHCENIYVDNYGYVAKLGDSISIGDGIILSGFRLGSKPSQFTGTYEKYTNKIYVNGIKVVESDSITTGLMGASLQTSVSNILSNDRNKLIYIIR